MRGSVRNLEGRSSGGPTGRLYIFWCSCAAARHSSASTVNDKYSMQHLPVVQERVGAVYAGRSDWRDGTGLTVTEASFSLFGIYGKRWGTATYRCLGSSRTCRFSFTCEAVGGGSEIGVGVSGGYVGGEDCKCDEDLAGRFDEVEFSAGGASITGTVGPGGCKGVSLGAGLGLGATLKGLICDYKPLGCK